MKGSKSGAGSHPHLAWRKTTFDEDGSQPQAQSGRRMSNFSESFQSTIGNVSFDSSSASSNHSSRRASLDDKDDYDHGTGSRSPMTPTTPGDDENGTAVVSNMPSAAPSRLGSHSEDHLPSRPSTGSQGGNIIKAVELAKMLEKKNSELNQVREALEAVTAKSKLLAQNVEKDASKKQVEIQEFEDEIAESRAHCKALQKALKIARTEIMEVKVQLKKCQEELAIEQGKTLSKAGADTALQKKVEELEKELARAKGDLEGMVRDQEQSTQLIGHLEECLALESVAQPVEHKDEDNARLRNELMVAKSEIIILKAQLASESKTASNASPSVNSGLLPLVSPVESLAKSSGRVQGRLGGASGGRQWDVELTDRLNVIQERVADCQARVGGMLHATAMSSHAQYEAKAGR